MVEIKKKQYFYLINLMLYLNDNLYKCKKFVYQMVVTQSNEKSNFYKEV